jgi:hypothetical protein
MNNETHQNMCAESYSKSIGFLDMLANPEDTEVINEKVLPTKCPEHFIIHSSCGGKLSYTMF